jgi:uncharacterized protein (DUF488 family)
VVLEDVSGQVLEAILGRMTGQPSPHERPPRPAPGPDEGRGGGGPRLATVGVYGFDVDRFLETLREAGVGTLIDVRQRRGVRGREYAWANARRLQSALAAAGIEYRHRRELAPTTELRHLQYREDARQGVGRRSRVELAPEYRERYTREILDQVDLGPLLDGLPTDTATALLCVEADARACHRSIIAERLAGHGVEVTHLRP